jgi:hypothetical protein
VHVDAEPSGPSTQVVCSGKQRALRHRAILFLRVAAIWPRLRELGRVDLAHPAPGSLSNRRLGQVNAAGRPYAALVKAGSPLSAVVHAVQQFICWGMSDQTTSVRLQAKRRSKLNHKLIVQKIQLDDLSPR